MVEIGFFFALATATLVCGCFILLRGKVNLRFSNYNTTRSNNIKIEHDEINRRVLEIFNDDDNLTEKKVEDVRTFIGRCSESEVFGRRVGETNRTDKEFLESMESYAAWLDSEAKRFKYLSEKTFQEADIYFIRAQRANNAGQPYQFILDRHAETYVRAGDLRAQMEKMRFEANRAIDGIVDYRRVRVRQTLESVPQDSFTSPELREIIQTTERMEKKSVLFTEKWKYECQANERKMRYDYGEGTFNPNDNKLLLDESYYRASFDSRREVVNTFLNDQTVVENQELLLDSKILDQPDNESAVNACVFSWDCVNSLCGVLQIVITVLILSFWLKNNWSCLFLLYWDGKESIKKLFNFFSKKKIKIAGSDQKKLNER